MTARLRWGALYVQGLSLLTALLGLSTIFSAATPVSPARLPVLDALVSTFVQQGAALVTMLLGFVLLVLARSLWQRKRSGWLLTVSILSVNILLHLLKGLDYEQAVLSVGLLIGLLLTFRQFHASSDAISTRWALRLLGLSLLVTWAYGTLGLTLLEAHFTPAHPLAENALNVLRLFSVPSAVTTQFRTSFGFFFLESIYVLAFVSFTAGVILLSRSVIVRDPATDPERQRARAIVEQYGRSSVAYFALLADKSYYFSKGGSVIAYVAKNNIGLALGDPIGPDADVTAAIREFRAYCQSQGWQAAFYQVLPDHLDRYKSVGYKTLSIGQEAIIDLQSFTLSGNARKSLRQHVNRTQKRGYTTQLHEPPFSDEMLDTLQAISDEWLAEIDGTEKRFSLGWFYDAYLQDNLIMTVSDSDGDLCAFANILPEYTRNEVTIDLMRHSSDVETGVMDFLFVALFNWAKDAGYDTFNLGLAALAGVGEEPQDPRLERGLHYLYEHLNQFYNFKGLYKFKAKFTPQWEDRYLIYPNLVSLPAVAVALIRADSGDDFLWAYLHEWRLALREQRQSAAQMPAPTPVSDE